MNALRISRDTPEDFHLKAYHTFGENKNRGLLREERLENPTTLTHLFRSTLAPHFLMYLLGSNRSLITPFVLAPHEDIYQCLITMRCPLNQIYPECMGQFSPEDRGLFGRILRFISRAIHFAHLWDAQSVTAISGIGISELF
jgi:hypothetical protein